MAGPKGPRARISERRRNIGKTGKGAFPPSVPFEQEYHARLQGRKFAAVYLSECIVDEDPKIFLVGLRDVIAAHGGMAHIAESAGVNRERLYNAVSKKGNPSIGYLKRILEVLNIRLKLA
ncbi:MAG: addiction module antidote protein [Fibrobacteria bacterium]